MLPGFITIIIGYLLGSFPTAYIIARTRKGIDIRDVDVGNVGAAATIRQVGIVAGLIVAAVDMAKGAASILIAQALGVSDPWVLGSGFTALLGHCYPLYIGFRGGQGTATVMGIFFVLAPYMMMIILVLMGIVLFFTRRIFAMICIVAPTLPLIIWIFGGSIALIIYSLIIIIFMSLRNRKGITKEVLGINSFIKYRLRRNKHI